MKVKDLIKLLKKIDQESIVVSQDYIGCCHFLNEIKVNFIPKGSNMNFCSGHTNIKLLSKAGLTKIPLVFININD